MLKKLHLLLEGVKTRFSDAEWRLNFALSVSLAVLLAWSILFHVDRIVRAEGRFIAATRPQVVQHLEGGIVSELLVAEGGRVAAGQPVMRLSSVQATSSVQAGQSRLLALLGQQARLKAELAGKSEIEFDSRVSQDIRALEEASLQQKKLRHAAEVSVVRESMTQRRAELDESNRRAEALRGELQVSSQQRQVLDGLLKKGAASQLEVLDARAREERLTTQYHEALNSLPRLKASVAEANARVGDINARYKNETQTELTQVSAEILRIEAAVEGDVDRLSRTELVAPTAGYINRVYVTTIGGVVKPGEPLFEITPTDGMLTIEARVRPDDRASLMPGLPAKVKVGAYDFALYGALDASVVEVSADTMPDEQGQRYYRVLLQAQSPTGALSKEVILPGMTAKADIVLGQRRIISYFLSPLLRFSSEVLREK